MIFNSADYLYSSEYEARRRRLAILIERAERRYKRRFETSLSPKLIQQANSLIARLLERY